MTSLFAVRDSPPVAEADVARAKQKLLIDLLCLCIERSRVSELVSIDTVRYLVESGIGDLHRGGEFVLEPLWELLGKERQLTLDAKAGPLLRFKMFEESMGLVVRLPAEVEALPAARSAILRAQIMLPKPRVEALVELLRTVESDPRVAEQVMRPAAPRPPPRPQLQPVALPHPSLKPAPASFIPPAPPTEEAPRPALSRSLLVMIAAALGLLVAVWIVFAE